MSGVRLVVCVSALILSGLPAMLMQIGAWGLMVGQRGESEAVADLVKVVLLGTEPCHRCLVVAENVGKAQGDERALWDLTGARLMNLNSESLSFSGRGEDRLILTFSLEASLLSGRSESPPSPPPRNFFIS